MKFFPSIGIDEVGRGAWAGPFVACAVLVREGERRVSGVRDSKMLSAKQRERVAPLLQQHHVFGVGIVTVQELDSLGMTKVQTVVFERAIAALTSSSSWPRPGSDRRPDSGQARMTTLGGIFTDGLPIKSHPEWTAIVDGDQKIYSIAAASIITKVARDQMMRELHTTEDRYRFDLHKGYGTSLHQQMLVLHGPSVHHRRLFAPIRKLYTVAR